MYIYIYIYIYIDRYIIYQYWGIETYFKIIADETGRYLNASDASSCPLDDWGSRLMFFKILAKRFTVSLGKPGICSMAKKSYDIRVQVFHHTPWPPFSTHRPHRQRKEKWCRLLTWQCWNKKHQWTDRHIAKKVWHLIFIYIFIYIYYNRIIYSYIYIL